MFATYESIFDGATIITKKDLCSLLDLDPTRPNLAFTASEINTAYKKKSLRYHPDRQQTFKDPIPKEVCTLLMGDISKARDYLLAGEENIPGKKIQENKFNLDQNSVITVIIASLLELAANRESIDAGVFWLYFGSSAFWAVLPLATFSDGQLNLRYLSILRAELNAVRSVIKDVDSDAVASFLRFLQQQVASEKDLSLSELMQELNKAFPELVNAVSDEEHWADLVQAINTSREELKILLTDDFINKMDHITKFWPDFIATVPSWSHLLRIYFTALLFTAGSIPRYVNALNVLANTVIEEKGIAAFSLIAFPFFVLSLALLPVNLMIKTLQSLIWSSLKALASLVVNSISALYFSFMILDGVFNSNDAVLWNGLINFASASINIFLRVPVNLVLNLVNDGIYLLSDKNVLSSFQADFNDLLDNWIKELYVRFDPTYEEQQDQATLESDDKSVDTKNSLDRSTQDTVEEAQTTPLKKERVLSGSGFNLFATNLSQKKDKEVVYEAESGIAMSLD